MGIAVENLMSFGQFRTQLVLGLIRSSYLVTFGFVGARAHSLVMSDEEESNFGPSKTDITAAEVFDKR